MFVLHITVYILIYIVFQSGHKKLQTQRIASVPSKSIWNGYFTQPFCHIPSKRSLDQCESITGVENGSLVCSAGSTVGSHCQLLCNEGFAEYSTTKQRVLSCRQRKKGAVWTREPNKCIPIESIPQIEHLTCSGKHPDAIIGIFDCNNSFKVSYTV